LEKVEANASIISIPPYMCIYLVVNVENLKIYETSMLDQEDEQVPPTIEDLEPSSQVGRVGRRYHFAKEIYKYMTWET
jgi:hypothetical protein